MFYKLAFILLLIFPQPGVILAETEKPVLRIAVLKFGTVIWELETIKRFGIDEKFGFTLHIQPIAGKQAAAVMLQSGETDSIVSDWIWAARQWQSERKFVALPYSKAVGGVVVRDPSLNSVADLRDRRIAVAGGPLDKNWLMIRAFTRNRHGFDLNDTADIVYASPPIVYRKMLAGEFDAAINFWPYLARSRARGMRFLTTTGEMIKAANLAEDIPLLVYLFPQKWAQKNRKLIDAFANSSRSAKARLRQDKAAWDELRPRMKATGDKEFDVLKTDFIAGIPATGSWPEMSKMQAWLDFLRQNGGAKLVGSAVQLSSDMFISADE